MSICLDNEFGAKWYYLQKDAFQHAFEQGHSFIVASDYEKEIKDGETGEVKVAVKKLFASYKTLTEFCNELVKLRNDEDAQPCFYEVVYCTCRVFFDIENWDDTFASQQDYASKFEASFREYLRIHPLDDDGFDPSLVRFLDSSDCKKRSLHFVYAGHTYPNILLLRDHFILPFLAYLREKGEMSLCNAIDKSIYTKNRMFRTIFSTKLGAERYFLPLKGHEPSEKALRESKYEDFFATFIHTSTLRRVFFLDLWVFPTCKKHRKNQN